MSDYWVRLNGQYELRENLRAAIRAAGISRAEAARRAEMKYSRLTAGLNGSTWLRREEAETLCAVLGITIEAVLGNSIFKGSPNEAEFDHQPPWSYLRRSERANAQRTTVEIRGRALCCQCGGLTRVTKALPGFVPEGPDDDGLSRGRRLVANLECETCRETTPHALLRVGTSDPAEAANRAPTCEQSARREREALIQRLAEFGVEVHFRAQRKKDRAKGYVTAYEYDESKHCWRIEVDPNAPTRVQVDVISECWRHISEDDHGSDVDWNPREGVISTGSSKAWDRATDELLDDITRVLSAERDSLRARAAARLVDHSRSEGASR